MADMTLEEALAAAEMDEVMANDIITIDPEKKTINLPESEMLFGVEEEKDVERKYFKCPRIVGDNIDLSMNQIYISYMVVNDKLATSIPGIEPESYWCNDVSLDESGAYITFSWRLSENVLKNSGFIGFAVIAKSADGEKLKTRWKTAPAVGTVLKSIPDTGESIEELHPDIIAQLIARMESAEEKVHPDAIRGYVKEYMDENPVQLDPELTDNTKAAPAGMVGELKKHLSDTAPAIIQTATGQTLAFHDSANRKLKGLKLFGKSTQNGTPTPDAPVPIVSVRDDGSVGVKVCGNNILNPNLTSTTFVPLKLKKGTALYLVVEDGKTSMGGNILMKDINNNNIWFAIDEKLTYSSIILQTDIEGYYNKLVRGVNHALYISNILLPYAPYTEQNITIQTPNGLRGIPADSGGNYTDENGQQWVSDEIDLERGKYVQRICKFKFDGSDDEKWILGQGAGNIKYRYSLILACRTLNSSKSEADAKSYCSNFQLGKNGSTWSSPNLYTINKYNIWVSLNGTEDLDTFKAYLAEKPMTVYAILETPIETAITPEEIAAYKSLTANYPNTTVMNDAGAEMEVSYAADSKIYIDNKFTELSAAIVNS